MLLPLKYESTRSSYFQSVRIHLWLSHQHDFASVQKLCLRSHPSVPNFVSSPSFSHFTALSHSATQDGLEFMASLLPQLESHM